MSLKVLLEIIQNMGLKYTLFRVYFEFKKKIGLLKWQFPSNYPEKEFISYDLWNQKSSGFFFNSKDELLFAPFASEKLKIEAEGIIEGKFLFFSSLYVQIDFNDENKWYKNYDNGSVFPKIHWTDIQDFSAEFGDIKYVWELSRFSYLITLIRYDYHFGKDQSKLVLGLIEDWIDNNPINMGPNYKCSQEISLRLFNWTFALHYFKNSSSLNSVLFKKIINSINLQYKHVFKNIHFSRIAVRNNHALTECMCLFLIGKLFPFLDNAKKYSTKGKAWFEEEINYQIYDDGTFLQFSMNYHRVAVQLMTWTITLSNKNNWKLDPIVTLKAQKSIGFLFASMNLESGELPNYGANDGALFFPLNNSFYRDYRAQLNALNFAIYNSSLFEDPASLEDIMWLFNKNEIRIDKNDNFGLFKFETGGYYIYNDPLDNTKSFIRCGNHKDRPSHADNLHLDIWDGTENILRDSGTYKYNTKSEYKEYFTGTASHNTVMLGQNNQMKKGNRFIWFNWTQALSTKFYENDQEVIFEGEISVFNFIDKDIRHKRTWRKQKGLKFWEVKDSLFHDTDLPLIQSWHTSSYFDTNYEIISNKDLLKPAENYAWFSGHYGIKEPCRQITFTTPFKSITTQIKAK